MTVKSRITASYKEGKGDSGLSDCTICSSKDFSNIELQIYSHLEELRNQIGKVLYYSAIKDDNLVILLTWLQNNSFSFGAILKVGYDNYTGRHSLDETVLSNIEEYIAINKHALGDCQDFLMHYGIYGELDSIRVKVRKLESIFNTFYLDNPSENIRLYITVLNRISSALFWAVRKEYKLNHSTEIYWNGASTPLNFTYTKSNIKTKVYLTGFIKRVLMKIYSYTYRRNPSRVFTYIKG